MNNTIKVLDHGFVTLRNIAGPTRRIWDTDDGEPNVGQDPGSWTREFDADDTDPANAARMSFNQTDSGRTREQDLKLAKYLMINRHTSPFEMISVWLEMKMPIFVARQLIRHRTTRVNEMSGRYVTLPEEWYIPEIVGGAPVNKKQGQADNLDGHCQMRFKQELNAHCNSGYQLYLTAINNGVAPEHARMFLSLNHYTHWIWNQDLHNVMHLLSLRDHSHAQIESQMYAQAITTLLRRVLPATMDLYDKYRKLP